jgi:hypothetical protein
MTVTAVIWEETQMNLRVMIYLPILLVMVARQRDLVGGMKYYSV